MIFFFCLFVLKMYPQDLRYVKNVFITEPTLMGGPKGMGGEE